MSDNKAADDVVRAIEVAVAAYPNQRVGQVIANAMRWFGGYGNCDPFYVSNEKLTEFLRDYASRAGAR